MGKPNSKYYALRAFAAIAVLLVVSFFVLIARFSSGQLHGQVPSIAQAGHLDLTAENPQWSPIQLDGQWEVCYENAYTTPEESLAFAGETEFLTFPIGSITDAQRSASYRLTFSLEGMEEEPLMLLIPNFGGEVEVYLNGVEQARYGDGAQWVEISTLYTLITLEDLRLDSPVQELIIHGDFQNAETTLYKRPIFLGTQRNLTTMALYDGSSELFLIGALFLVLINGFVFMIFRPNHRIISLITLFDTLVMVRIIFSMNYAISFMGGMFARLGVSDGFCAASGIFFLMMAGFTGCILSGTLFDPEHKVPRWLTAPMPYIYLIFAISFPGNLTFFEDVGRWLLMGVYLITFIGVFCQFVVCWRTTNKRGYYLFQFIKTSYIGLLVLFDIFFWNRYVATLLLFYLYAIFFIMHVVIRLYDNNQSYRDVELLNQGLEGIVAERTQELSQANRILSELSIRDPLTGAFNRLYFETALEKAVKAHRENGVVLHLSIFDLDFFKHINDTYGHDVGDDQLRALTQLVSSNIEEDVVFARIGGEEFILLFKGWEDQAVMASIQRVHAAIEIDAKSSEKRTTASFGVAKAAPTDSGKVLLKKADVALYEAKNSGRNRVVYYTERTEGTGELESHTHS